MSEAKGRFIDGNQAAVIHGGAAARRALTSEAPFTGLARDVEKDLAAELATEGPAAMLTKDCLRIHTAAELYWQAILGSVEAGDMTKFESYVKTYGWLATAGARLLGQLCTLQGKETRVDALEVLQSLQGGSNDKTSH